MLEKKTVFLVDDHPLVREWLANLINQQSGLVVCGEAESATLALSTILELKPAIVIADISLKDSSGFDLIDILRQRCPKVSVLVLSMHEESYYAERALRAGARGYLIKQETSKNVLAAIRAVLEGKTYLSQTLSGAASTASFPHKALPAASSLQVLSDRESEVFRLIGQGLATGQIAQRLALSIKTIETHCARMKEKLHLATTIELRRQAVLWSEGEHFPSPQWLKGDAG